LSTLVSITQTSGVSSVSEASVKAFPNPLDGGALWVEASDRYDRWQVFSSAGRLLDEGPWMGTSMPLPADAWPSGPLMVVLTGEAGRAVLPVVKR